MLISSTVLALSLSHTTNQSLEKRNGPSTFGQRPRQARQAPQTPTITYLKPKVFTPKKRADQACIIL